MAQAHFGSPAHQAAMGNLPGMMLIAGATMGLAQGLFNALDGIAEAKHQQAHYDALGAAKAHAYEMEDLARAAVLAVAELEAEVASLRQACQQRQDVIVALSSGRA
ncbi:hypothetical protein [Allorhizobium borbori]|uniref:Uncharacterized protein n=1 Tax=Allorhizobium borbori TaxID=485907 RepID=A0A7W6JZJ0_9HYPH|nr:hypothetical protein [Allorhizobium borbori]MBB4102419.1 hypothetical protein [Allorhizobium borbori]